MNVFVRWRPLIGAETAAGSVNHHTTAAASSPLLAVTVHRRLSPSDKPWTSASGFDAVLDSTASNAAVFATVVLPAVPRVLAGVCCSFFAYGHSGSGKTHTVIGYDEDGDGSGAGLCLEAAQQLFAKITKRGAVEEDQSPLAIGLSVFELRQKAAFDLLNDGTRCHIRQGPDGKVHIRGETETHADGRVRVQPLAQQPCWTFSELRNALHRALARRAVGTSSVHDQSSRTHAVLALELVNAELVAARAALVDRQSELVPVGKRATDITVAEQTRAVLRSPGGTYRPRPDYVINQALIDQVTAEKEAAEARVAEAEAVVASVYERYRDAGLGGKMIFVDLAGAEYNQDSSIMSTATAKAQKPTEKHEARQINTDLLALKEVMRAWATRSPRRRVPYRASPLTMVLREAFTDELAMAGMVVTVSPANTHHAATLNALKYGSLMGTAAR
ncbi:kinesin family protein [Beauveria brongniartii RCEF 3172]|uniref:Kinesin-like protein n=1 Tax=Beauveria brongniartii RCEF 3172 TaxID=1081107 RepID=A0A167BVZ5_9HYPO|nr:kinesin family protein [Beauveria brongniartii RCEF 3172]